MCLHARFASQNPAYQDWLRVQSGGTLTNTPAKAQDPADEPGFQTELVKHKLTEMLLSATNQILRMDEVRSSLVGISGSYFVMLIWLIMVCYKCTVSFSNY